MKISNISFSGKSKKSRKIKFEIDGVKNYIFIQFNSLSYQKYFERDENVLDELRKIYIENYLWIWGWDLSEDDDFSKESLSKQFNLEYNIGKITEKERDYLIENLVSDYRKNKDKYPTFNENI